MLFATLVLPTPGGPAEIQDNVRKKYDLNEKLRYQGPRYSTVELFTVYLDVSPHLKKAASYWYRVP
jgi:hypothetical protein